MLESPKPEEGKGSVWQQMPAISQDQKQSMSPGCMYEIKVDFISICIPHTLLPQLLPVPLFQNSALFMSK